MLTPKTAFRFPCKSCIINRIGGAPPLARVVKLADTHGLGPCAERFVGSNPTSGTKDIKLMISALVKEQDATIKLTITISSQDIKKTWDDVINEEVKNAEVSGFRKGKAPRKLVEEKLDKNKIREEALRRLLPKYYTDAVKEHNLKPIINPKIHVEKIEDPSTSSGQVSWQFTALTCEAPTVELGSYKENIKKLTAKSKIVIPGKETKPPAFDEIVKILLEYTKVSIPKMLINQEVDRLLSQLLEEVKKLGLTLDQYLASTNKTPESVRKEYEQKAEFDIKIEFVLQKIAETEKIAVEEKEINEAVEKAKNEVEKKNLETNRYLLASILRQQKTLDFLKNL